MAAGSPCAALVSMPCWMAAMAASVSTSVVLPVMATGVRLVSAAGAASASAAAPQIRQTRDIDAVRLSRSISRPPGSGAACYQDGGLDRVLQQGTLILLECPTRS